MIGSLSELRFEREDRGSVLVVEERDFQYCEH